MRRYEVKVTPRAKRNEVVKRDGIFIVRVTAPADKGKANAAVLKLLANHLGIAMSRLSISHGSTSRHKVIECA